MPQPDTRANVPAEQRSRIQRGGRWIALALIVAFSASFGVVLGAGFDDSDGATASTMLSQMPEFQVLEETYDAIREHYVLSEDVTDEQLMYGASRGMVESLGDTGHSTFLDPQEATEFEQSLSSELIGIGIQIDLTGPQPVVIAPIDGSPAYEAGIQPGDVIIAVDGVQTADVDPQEVGDLIRGEDGTDVTLVLRHQDESDTYTVTVTRAKITVEPVSRKMLPNDLLWLRLSQFSTGSGQDVIEALQWGKTQGMTGVVLDLRNNPGGYTDEAKLIASQFLPTGSVIYQEQLADGTVVEIKNTDVEGEWADGPVAVLINEGSASSSEIVSSAIRDNGRGELIGETTFGTGTVLVGFQLSDGSVALLGTKLWLTADGNDIWKKGVAPSVEVATEPGTLPSLPIEFDGQTLTLAQLEESEDPQLQAAHEELKAVASN